MQLHSFLTAIEYGDEWSASHPARFNSTETAISKVDEREGGGSWYELPGPGWPERVRSSTMLHIFLSLSAM